MEIIGLSPDPSFYCPTDTVVYTCETTTPAGPTFLEWSIPEESAVLRFTFSGGVPPPVGETRTIAGAVAELIVVEANRWVSTLTITNPGSSFTSIAFTVRCADSSGSDNQRLSVLGKVALTIALTCTCSVYSVLHISVNITPPS